MNVEELLTLWRYRHALMVQRMIGVKIGTGGSAGHDYLRDTAAEPPHLLRSVPAVDLSHSALAAAEAAARGRGRDGLQVHGGAGRDDARSARRISANFAAASGAHSSRRAQPSFLAGRGVRRPSPRARRCRALADNKWETVFGDADAARAARHCRAAGPARSRDHRVRTQHPRLRAAPVVGAAGRIATPRILTSDSEFHSFTRQIARLEEDGLVAVERIAAEPFASFPERFASAARRGGHDLVFVSQVFFNSAGTSGRARRYRRRGCRSAIRWS